MLLDQTFSESKHVTPYCADRKSECSSTSILDSRCTWSILAIKYEPVVIFRASVYTTLILTTLVGLALTLQTDVA